MVRGLESPHRIGGYRGRKAQIRTETPQLLSALGPAVEGVLLPPGCREQGEALEGLVGPQAAPAGNLLPGSRWSRGWVQRRGDIICKWGHHSSLAIWAVGGAGIMLCPSHLSTSAPSLRRGFVPHPSNN